MSGLVTGLQLEFVGRGLAMLQPDVNVGGNSTTLTVFVGITTLCFVILAVVAVAILVQLKKGQKELMEHVTEIKAKAMPLIEKSHALVTDLTPQIKEITAKTNQITGHVGEIVAIAKDKAQEFSPTVSEANVMVRDAIAKAKVTFDAANAHAQVVLEKAQTTFDGANQTVVDTNEKTRQQIDRVNEMVTRALDATVRLGKAIEHGVTAPARELAGLVNGAKETIDGLMKKTSEAGNVASKRASDLGSIFASKLADLFAKKTRPVPPAYRARTYQSEPVRPEIKTFGSMANAAGSGTQGPMEPGVSSGSGGNGDPIVG